MIRGLGSYCDEFGHPKDPNRRFMGIAGLLAWSDDWIALTDRWRWLQKEERIPNPFHMTDFVHHTEKFSDPRWESICERKRILSLLLETIRPCNVIPVAAGVSLRDFNSLTPAQQTQLVSPYHVAFQEVTFNIAFAAANCALQTAKEGEEFFGNRVAMVYAKLRKFTGPAGELWDAIKDAHAQAELASGVPFPGAGHWMGSYTPAEPADFPPLQAADIWAYSLGHRSEKALGVPKEEAVMASDFFVKATFLSQGLGYKFYTFFDRKEMLLRLGELPPELE